MKKIEIIIKPGSESSRMFKKYLEEKEAFKNAVVTGNVSSYVKKTGKKFDTPLSITK